jgi:uncharacterized protein (PEP-CTERM system associated)
VRGPNGTDALTVRYRASLLALLAIAVVARAKPAEAFPLIEPGDGTAVPPGQSLATPDEQSLQHQLQLVNGIASAPLGGWVISPRLDVQEMFTDNVLQAHSPRKWDLVSYLAPGISAAASMPRLQLQFSYTPTLSMYARTPSENTLSQQLSGIASVTAVPEWLYVDIRAVSGAQDRNGGVGGAGGIGATGASFAPTGGIISAGTLGTTKANLVQTSSFGVSPYLVHPIGDLGNARLGYSLNVGRSTSITGFAAAPFPIGDGTNGQRQVSMEEDFSFKSGEIFERLQDSVTATMNQTASSNDATFQGAAVSPGRTSSSRRANFSDQLTFAVSHVINVFASMGWESIDYGTTSRSIHDITWSVGGNWTPNEDSRISLSYGHQEGADSFQGDGYYALSARTSISGSYATTVGTQLENLQRQLNSATVGSSGTLVNGVDGTSLFGTTNALAVQNGVFRTNTLSLSIQTTIERDNLSLSLSHSTQTSIQSQGGSSSIGKTVSLGWTHALNPNLTFSSAAQFSVLSGTGSPAETTSIFANASLQYMLSETVSSSLRYSFYDRNGPTALTKIYTNTVILGVSKVF